MKIKYAINSMGHVIVSSPNGVDTLAYIQDDRRIVAFALGAGLIPPPCTEAELMDTNGFASTHLEAAEALAAKEGEVLDIEPEALGL